MKMKHQTPETKSITIADDDIEKLQIDVEVSFSPLLCFLFGLFIDSSLPFFLHSSIAFFFRVLSFGRREGKRRLFRLLSPASLSFGLPASGWFLFSFRLGIYCRAIADRLHKKDKIKGKLLTNCSMGFAWMRLFEAICCHLKSFRAYSETRLWKYNKWHVEARDWMDPSNISHWEDKNSRAKSTFLAVPRKQSRRAISVHELFKFFICYWPHDESERWRFKASIEVIPHAPMAKKIYDRLSESEINQNWEKAWRVVVIYEKFVMWYLWFPQNLEHISTRDEPLTRACCSPMCAIKFKLCN